jgi:hypothetical protein
MTRRNINKGPNGGGQYRNDRNNWTLGGDEANEHANQATSRAGDAISYMLDVKPQPHDDRVHTYGHGPGDGRQAPPVTPDLPESGLDPVSSTNHPEDQRSNGWD